MGRRACRPSQILPRPINIGPVKSDRAQWPNHSLENIIATGFIIREGVGVLVGPVKSDRAQSLFREHYCYWYRVHSRRMGRRACR